eukprot:15342763-Alexandrium_andersonii.AAC.1
MHHATVGHGDEAQDANAERCDLRVGASQPDVRKHGVEEMRGATGSRSSRRSGRRWPPFRCGATSSRP